MSKMYLVTGGAGFVGSHLCKSLLNDGHTVYAIDSFVSSDGSNLDELETYEKFNFFCGDIRHRDSFSHLPKLDGIFNLACPASPVHYQSIPVETMMTSVLGSYNLLKLALQNDCTILQASTSEVYGDPAVHPQPESYWGHVNSFGPRSCYDEGKRASEALFYDFHHSYGVDVRIVRIFNTYGPNMCADDGRVVSNFITQALEGKDLTIYGDGTQTRSFCYVSDLVRGIRALFDSNITTPVNLGNPTEFTMKELAEKVFTFTSNQSKIVFMALPTDDPKQRKPDITIAKEQLGWEPEVPLDVGLQHTIEYFKTKLG